MDLLMFRIVCCRDAGCAQWVGQAAVQRIKAAQMTIQGFLRTRVTVYRSSVDVRSHWLVDVVKRPIW
jgi:hypothetical protein